MADIFNTSVGDAIIQGVQVLRAAMASRQQLQLQRMELDQRKQHQEELLGLREQQIKVQQGMLDLKKQTAGMVKSLSPSQQLAMRRLETQKIEAQVQREVGTFMPPDLASLGSSPISDIRRSLAADEATLEAHKKNDFTRLQQDNADRRGVPGPLTPLLKARKAKSDYIELYNAEVFRRQAESPFAELFFGTPPAASTEKPTSPEAPTETLEAPKSGLNTVIEPPKNLQGPDLLELGNALREHERTGGKDTSWKTVALHMARVASASGDIDTLSRIMADVQSSRSITGDDQTRLLTEIGLMKLQQESEKRIKESQKNAAAPR